MNNIHRHPGSLLLLVSILFAGSALGAETPKRPKRAPASKSEGSALPTPREVEPIQQAKVVSYGRKDVATVNTKLRYTTLIVLPPAERILDFTIGDKEFWVVDGSENFAYVKPAKAGAHTNMNLITASGNIFSFLLVEVSATPEAQPDLKIFVEPSEESMVDAAKKAPRFVSVSEVENYRRQIEIAKDETREVKQAAQATIDSGITTFISNVRFPYRFAAGKAPFFVRAMYRDDKFTYIQARPEETPTLYEIKDGKPNLVNFDYKDGVYVADRILGRGYLAIGKKKLAFTSED
jgi:type IV secretion system protein VirB9